MDAIQEPSSIQLELQSLPGCVTLARAALSGVGERFGLDTELTDDLKTAVSEACNNVVLHAYPDAPGPLTVELLVDRDELRIAVIDSGAGISHVSAASADRMGVGLAVISALADRAEFQSVPAQGTTVRMSFAARGRPTLVHGSAPVLAAGGRAAGIDGDVVLSVAPVTLLGDVLGRVCRAIAASAHFSLDRFSDLYLVTDEIAAHARASSASGTITCALSSAPGRLELVIGPFRTGTVQALADGDQRTAYSFTKLVDELTVEPRDDGDLLRVIIVDQR